MLATNRGTATPSPSRRGGRPRPAKRRRTRAEFATKQLWVTREAPDELSAAGAYPSRTTGGDGIPSFIAAKRVLERQDIVIWYTVGTSHIVRPEDFPVSPVHRSGFALRPWGFFDANPAMDMALSSKACGHLPGACTCDSGTGGIRS